MRGPSAFHSVAENPPEDDKTEAIPTIADVTTNQPSSTPVISDSPSPHHEIDGASKKRKRPIEGNGFGRGERKKSTKAAQAAKLLPLSRMPTKVDMVHFSPHPPYSNPLVSLSNISGNMSSIFRSTECHLTAKEGGCG